MVVLLFWGNFVMEENNQMQVIKSDAIKNSETPIVNLKQSMEKNKKKERGNHGKTLLPVSHHRHPDKSKKRKK